MEKYLTPLVSPFLALLHCPIRSIVFSGSIIFAAFSFFAASSNTYTDWMLTITYGFPAAS